mgnify:CR=1 FL=1
MGFFSFIQEIAMDLGTANTIIISDDKIVVDEPSVVALDRRTDKMIAVGEKAKMMYEKHRARNSPSISMISSVPTTSACASQVPK